MKKKKQHLENETRGRPTLKTPERVAKIMQLAKEGKTDKQIAEIVGMGDRTIRTWKVEDWEFSAFLKENKALADELVEASTFRRAVGYSHPDEKIFWDSKNQRVIREECVTHYPPDATSAIFWLKNRKPKEWRDKVEIEQESIHTFVLDTGNGTKRFPG